ncbi:unnamed protein product, partial [Amoebophrya sp. A120]|eukprot:GSA120T00025466001.1
MAIFARKFPFFRSVVLFCCTSQTIPAEPEVLKSDLHHRSTLQKQSTHPRDHVVVDDDIFPSFCAVNDREQQELQNLLRASKEEEVELEHAIFQEDATGANKGDENNSGVFTHRHHDPAASGEDDDHEMELKHSESPKTTITTRGILELGEFEDLEEGEENEVGRLEDIDDAHHGGGVDESTRPLAKNEKHAPSSAAPAQVADVETPSIRQKNTSSWSTISSTEAGVEPPRTSAPLPRRYCSLDFDVVEGAQAERVKQAIVLLAGQMKQVDRGRSRGLDPNYLQENLVEGAAAGDLADDFIHPKTFSCLLEANCIPVICGGANTGRSTAVPQQELGEKKNVNASPDHFSGSSTTATPGGGKGHNENAGAPVVASSLLSVDIKDTNGRKLDSSGTASTNNICLQQPETTTPSTASSAGSSGEKNPSFSSSRYSSPSDISSGGEVAGDFDKDNTPPNASSNINPEERLQQGGSCTTSTRAASSVTSLSPRRLDPKNNLQENLVEGPADGEQHTHTTACASQLSLGINAHHDEDFASPDRDRFGLPPPRVVEEADGGGPGNDEKTNPSSVVQRLGRRADYINADAAQEEPFACRFSFVLTDEHIGTRNLIHPKTFSCLLEANCIP